MTVLDPPGSYHVDRAVLSAEREIEPIHAVAATNLVQKARRVIGKAGGLVEVLVHFLEEIGTGHGAITQQDPGFSAQESGPQESAGDSGEALTTLKVNYRFVDPVPALHNARRNAARAVAGPTACGLREMTAFLVEMRALVAA
jgi:hypothetical protein